MGLLSNLLSAIVGSSTEPEPHEHRRSTTRPPTQRKIQQNKIVILIVGRSGAGKTSLIDALCRPNPSGVAAWHKNTTEAVTYHTELYEKRFSLIDTPGFDNVGLSDTAVCTKIAEYFWEPGRFHLGVNGIIYIHRAGDPLRSRALRRYLTVLSRIFLGNEGMRRLTIFIPGAEPHGLESAQISEELRDSSSILSQASAAGARVTCTGGVQEGFTDIVKSYKSASPTVLPIQLFNPNLASELDIFLCEKPIQAHIGNQDTRLRSYQHKLEELRSTIDIKDREVVQYREAYEQIKDLQDNQQRVEEGLRQQLQQVQREYASLRSELQLQENFEQSELVQELEDINRLIDDISRSISAYLTDNHVRTTFQKETSEVTSLDARNPADLFKMLGYHEGETSLVSSQKGEGLDIESFLDFTIRDMLCTLLVSAIFRPFHPAIDSEQSNALLRAYEDIQKQESQTRSGKWRSTTFKSIYKDNNPYQVTTWINRLLTLFVRQRLNPLITYVFGNIHAPMDRQHFNHMHELLKRAWDWNAKLKGEVVVLGDFRQTMHSPHSKFDPDTMKDFEPQRSRQPTSVLGTLGLGLVSLRAVAGGLSPEETLVCKAIVATDTLYA